MYKTTEEYIQAKLFLNDELKTLVAIQDNHNDNKKDKNNAVRSEIAFLHSVLEFIKEGKNEIHLGRLSRQMKFKSNECIAILIEESSNKDIRRFCKRIIETVFPTYIDYLAFAQNANRRLIIK